MAIIKNPVIFQNLCTMRDKNTDSQGVRIATRKITRVLLYEAAKNLPLVEKEIARSLLMHKLNSLTFYLKLKFHLIIQKKLLNILQKQKLKQ